MGKHIDPRLLNSPVPLLPYRQDVGIGLRTATQTEPFRPPGRAGLPSLSCVIPSHNEAANLALLLPLLQQTLAGCSRAWEVIVVDDGSTDRSAELLDDWSQRAGFRTVGLSRNFGKEAALSAGLQAAHGEVVVLLDADLQHPPALIHTFVQHWQAGADVVFAQRLHRRDESRIKRWGAAVFYALMNFNDRFEVPSGAGDFRLMDRSVVDALLSLHERNRFMKGLYAWVGFSAVAVPYSPPARANGASNFGLLRLARLSVVGLMGFTTWPLRVLGAAGMVMALLAFVYGAFLSVSYLVSGHQVSGWTTIVVSLMLLSGIQLVSIGVVAEYVGRIFEEVKARPLYVVKREAGHGLSVDRP